MSDVKKTSTKRVQVPVHFVHETRLWKINHLNSKKGVC